MLLYNQYPFLLFCTSFENFQSYVKILSETKLLQQFAIIAYMKQPFRKIMLLLS